MSESTRKLSEKEIDRLVIAEAEDDSAWEDPIQVKRGLPSSFSLPPELAARADFLARLHHERALESWLTRIIRERIELEEVAFAEAKREIAGRSGS